MDIDFQERRVIKRFEFVDDEVKCLCIPTQDAEGLVLREEEDASFVEVGKLVEVVNLLRESDSEKCAGSEYMCPELCYQVTVEVPVGAKLRKYLGFSRKDSDTQLEVVAEDLWAEGRLKALAAEIELWYFLSLNEASKIMMLKLPEFKDLILESVRGPTRAKFLAGYWFAVLGRKALL